jgi:hypothetical protein
MNKILHAPESSLDGHNEYIDPRYTVAFIVEADGQINSGRVVHDNTNQIGEQILKAVKNCRWLPGQYNDKKVPVLYSFSVIIDFQKE